MVFVVEEGHSIQMAVNAAEPGDTVLVRGGVYHESLAIPAGKDRLRVIGAGPDATVLDGTGLPGAAGVVIEGATFVTVAGFTVRNFAGCGIAVRSDGNVIRNNAVTENAEDGIVVDGRRNLIKENTAAHNGRHGIAVGSGSHQYLIGNDVRRNGADGITAGPDAACALILENTVDENRGAGISVASGGSWVIGNGVHDNGADGIRVDEAANVLVYGNTAAGNAGTGIGALGDGTVAAKNTVRSNGAYGVRVAAPAHGAADDMDGALFYDNAVSQNMSSGLGGQGAVRYALVLQNRIDANGEAGVGLPGGDGNRVLANAVEANEGAGIGVGGDVRASLVDDNQVHNNRGAGIRLTSDVRQNTLRANKLRKNAPFDVQTEAPAVTQNVFDLNECGNSAPPGICH